MKQLKLFSYLCIAALGVLFTSCGEDTLIDPPIDGGGDGAQVTLLDEFGDPAPDVEVSPGGNFSVIVDAVAGENEMNTFSVEEDGVTIDLSRVLINGSPADANPTLLFDSERTSFTWEVTVFAHEDAAFRTYSFVIIDSEGNRGSQSVNVDTDSVGSGGDTPPEITVGGSENVTVEPNSLYSVKISATPVSGRLASISVYQDGTLISDVSRLEFAGNDFDSNPYELPEALKDGFVEETLFIRVQDSGESVYRVLITDEFGNSSEFTKTINAGTSGTPVSTIVGVLLNQAGPAGTGGLDLDNGNSTGSADLDAEIRDMGIDNGPIADNWLQQIAGVNGSVVKQLIAGQNGLLESFSFGNVSVREEIIAVHDNNGIDFSGGVSNTVLVGDVFSVENNGRYYLLQVTNINVTTDDNNDSYTFDVKK